LPIVEKKIPCLTRGDRASHSSSKDSTQGYANPLEKREAIGHDDSN